MGTPPPHCTGPGCKMSVPLPQMITGSLHHQPNPAAWHNVALRSLPVAPHKNSVDRSRVDFLYYDGEVPLYDYFYRDYDFDERIDGVVDPPRWTKVSAPPWDNHHPQLPEEKLQTGVSSSGSPGGLGGLSWLPRLAILPLIALASYLAYFIFVENAPTPVVRERGVEEGRRMVGVTVENVLEMISRMEKLLPSLPDECMDKLDCMFQNDITELGIDVDDTNKDTMIELGTEGDIMNKDTMMELGTEGDEMTECGKWFVNCSPHIWSAIGAATQTEDSQIHAA